MGTQGRAPPDRQRPCPGYSLGSFPSRLCLQYDWGLRELIRRHLALGSSERCPPTGEH